MSGVQLIGQSKTVQEMLNLVRRVASTKTNVLIVGESGTGKELVARMVHDIGPLKDRAFVPVNCGAIPENLIESEMFGHVKGSFTGAVSDKEGLFETADGGSLFLDEIGELPLPMQVKLLRAIQERVIRRVGGTDDKKIDVRIIAATNRDLEKAVKDGTFREDLYYRLNVIQVRTPPLKERKGDIPLLADFFLKKFNKKNGKNIGGIDSDALAALEAYAWPGNVRELENVLERAVALESGVQISVRSIPAHIAGGAAGEGEALSPSPAPRASSAAATRFGAGGSTGVGGEGRRPFVDLPEPDFSKGPLDLEAILSQVEQAYLAKALEASGGVKKKAAELLGITFRSIRYRLAKTGAGGEGEE